MSKESEVSFPQLGSTKDGGRGTLPNPIGSGVEQLPVIRGAAVAEFSIPIKVQHATQDWDAFPFPGQFNPVVKLLDESTPNLNSFIILDGVDLPTTPQRDSFGNPVTMDLVLTHYSRHGFGFLRDLGPGGGGDGLDGTYDDILSHNAIVFDQDQGTDCFGAPPSELPSGWAPVGIGMSKRHHYTIVTFL